MRVVSGKAKGRQLKAPAGQTTRPTGDRVRESLFAILGNEVIDSCVLDLFAGTGALGIEALSRGAKKAVFVDADPRCRRVIQANLQHAGLKGEVFTNDAFRALRALRRRDLLFDIVFLDPPYGNGLAVRALETLTTADILRPSGLIVVESGLREEIPACVLKFSQERVEKYGDTLLTFFR